MTKKNKLFQIPFYPPGKGYTLVQIPPAHQNRDRDRDRDMTKKNVLLQIPFYLLGKPLMGISKSIKLIVHLFVFPSSLPFYVARISSGTMIVNFMGLVS